ncbi:MAG: hypothetical protein ACXQTW_02225 [Candidatus Methanospirareceae archaeon]
MRRVWRLVAMKRTNTFKLNPTKEEETILLEWADNCSRMFNEINTGKRILRILVRPDSYKLDNKYLKLPFKLKVKWKGKNKWAGKPGRLEIVHDTLSGQWICYQPVEVESLHQPKSNKVAYVDLGVKCPIVADFVNQCWERGVSEIVCGDLREIRKEAKFSKKSKIR